MAATLLKKLRHAANDFPAKVKKSASPARVTPVITLAQKHHTFFRAVTLVLLGILIGMGGCLIGYMQGTRRAQPAVTAAPAPAAVAPAKIVVKLEREGSKNITMPLAEVMNPAPQSTAKPETQPTKADANIDIVLPAESLLPPKGSADADIAPAPDSNPAIAVVTDKINDLPALHEVTHQTEGHARMVSQGNVLTEEQLLNNAHLLLESGDDATALEIYNRILAHDKTSRPALAGKMYGLQKIGDYENAIDTGHQLLKLDPGDETTRSNLVAALGQSYSPAAMTELRQIIDNAPGNAAAHVALARLLMRRGYYEQAFAELQKATKIAPDNLGFRLDMAILYDRAGYAADAVALYQQVVQASADQEDTRLALSTAAIRQRIAYLNAGTEAPP